MAEENTIEIVVKAVIDQLNAAFAEAGDTIDASTKRIVTAVATAMAGVEASVHHAGEHVKEEAHGIDASFREIQESVERAEKAFSGLAEFFLVALGVEKIIDLGKEAAESGERIEQGARKAAVGVETYQELAFAATQAGVSQEEMGVSLSHLQRAMVEAQNGSAKAVDAFDAVGLSAKQLAGLTTDQILAKVAARFAETKDSAEKTEVAFRLFGRSGADLIPLLDKGAAGLEEAAARARELGIVTDAETIKKQAEAAEKFKELGAVMDHLKIVAGTALIDSFVQIAHALTEISKDGSGLQSFFEGVGEVFKAVAYAGSYLTEGLYILAKGLAETALIANDIVHGNFKDIIHVFADTGNEAISAAEKFSKFREELYEPLPTPKQEKGEIAPTKDIKLGDSEGRSKALQTEFAIEQAHAKALSELLKEGISEREKEIKDDYRNHLIDAQTYYGQLKQLQMAASDSEIQIIQTRIAQTQRMESSAKKPEEAGKYEAKLVELQGQLALAEAKRGNAALQIDRELANAMEAQAKSLIELEDSHNTKLAELDAKSAESRAQYEINQGRQTEDSLYAIQRASEDRIFALKAQGLRDRLTFAHDDVVEQRKINGELEELERSHQEAVTKISRDAEEYRKRNLIAAEDVVRGALSSTIDKLATGKENLKQAFSDLFKSILEGMIQLADQQLVKSLLGAFGTTGEGSALGGSVASALGSIFGGGKAQGGSVMPGHVYEFAESGPEFLSAGGRTFLAMGGSSGYATPAVQAVGGGMVINNYNNYQAPQDNRTHMQVGAAAAAGVLRAMNRNG